MNKDQYTRYNRQLLLSEIGVDGQNKLLKSRVLLIGAGGLGSPIAIYLAAAGVGAIGIVEFDKIDLSNLQRQILYDTSQVGLPKVKMAAERLNKLNPDVTVVEYDELLTSSNIIAIFNLYDYIIDATDNFSARFLINDTCVFLGKTYVYGSIYNFEGQVSVFNAKDGPCYRCVIPNPPDPKIVPSSLELGVFGILPGVIGSIQATEVVKLICGIGNGLVGRMLLYDALMMETRTIKILKNINCPVCGKNPSIKILAGYEKICGIESFFGDVNAVSARMVNKKLKQQSDLLLLDVRDDCEYAGMHIEQALHIPLNSLYGRINEIEQYRNTEIITFCQAGPRGMAAAKVLLSKGYKQVSVLENGLFSWCEEKLPIVR